MIVKYNSQFVIDIGKIRGKTYNYFRYIVSQNNERKNIKCKFPLDFRFFIKFYDIY